MLTPIHKQEQNGAQAICQESRELCFGHLARSRDKVRMNGFAVPQNTAIPFTLHGESQIVVARVAANYRMVIQEFTACPVD
jgi:hypothetical protein